MKVKYLFHSGVSVESDDTLYIFDYYRKGFETNNLNNYNHVYVFASHNHGDHFDESIMEWIKIKPDIKYILSDDINVKASDNILLIHPPNATNLNLQHEKLYRILSVQEKQLLRQLICMLLQ